MEGKATFTVIPGRANASPESIATGRSRSQSWGEDRPKDNGLGLWVPAPVRNCALGGNDTDCWAAALAPYILCIDTEIFGPFLMVW
jgi:hypothetical protein